MPASADYQQPEDRQVSPSGRFTITFEYEKEPGQIFLETLRFEACDGKTEQTEKTVFQSVDDHKGLIRMAIDQGVTETIHRLAALLTLDMQRSAHNIEAQ